MIKVFFYSLISILIFSACVNPIERDEVAGCWTVAYIDTDGVKMKVGNYQMCFENNGILISQKKDGSEKVQAEWNMEEEDSSIVLHYKGGSMPDTAKIVKYEEEEMHLRMKKGQSYVTLYLRKEK